MDIHVLLDPRMAPMKLVTHPEPDLVHDQPNCPLGSLDERYQCTLFPVIREVFCYAVLQHLLPMHLREWKYPLRKQERFKLYFDLGGELSTCRFIHNIIIRLCKMGEVRCRNHVDPRGMFCGLGVLFSKEVMVEEVSSSSLNGKHLEQYRFEQTRPNQPFTSPA